MADRRLGSWSRCLVEIWGRQEGGPGDRGPLTPSSSSDLKPKATEDATEREKEGIGFSQSKRKQERIRTDVLAKKCQVSGQSEVSWLIDNPRDSSERTVTAGRHELCGWPLGAVTSQ